MFNATYNRPAFHWHRDVQKAAIPPRQHNRLYFQNVHYDVRNSNVIGEASDSEGPSFVSSVSFSRTGSLLAVSASDLSVELWCPERVKMLHKLEGHSEITTASVWSHVTDGVLYTSSLDKSIIVWSKAESTFDKVCSLKGADSWIRCLSLSIDNVTLVSGCVNASVVGWDTFTGQQMFRIADEFMASHPRQLNSVNSVDYCATNPNVFAAGVRNGVIKLWDNRSLAGPVMTMQAHDSKLNTVQFGLSDRWLLTSGRDSSLRLWDLRMVGGSSNSHTVPGFTSALVQEYKEHICSGYNIASQFFSQDEYILTGSEDSKAYVYETRTGRLAHVLQGHKGPVHLIAAQSVNRIPIFVTASIDNDGVTVWKPDLKKNAQDLVERVEPEPNNALRVSEMDIRTSRADVILGPTYRSSFESLMRKYADEMIYMLCKHNITVSLDVNWQTLHETVGPDNPESDLLVMLGSVTTDLRRTMLEFERVVRSLEVENRAGPEFVDPLTEQFTIYMNEQREYAEREYEIKKERRRTLAESEVGGSTGMAAEV